MHLFSHLPIHNWTVSILVIMTNKTTMKFSMQALTGAYIFFILGKYLNVQHRSHCTFMFRFSENVNFQNDCIISSHCNCMNTVFALYSYTPVVQSSLLINVLISKYLGIFYVFLSLLALTQKIHFVWFEVFKIFLLLHLCLWDRVSFVSVKVWCTLKFMCILQLYHGTFYKS